MGCGIWGLLLFLWWLFVRDEWERRGFEKVVVREGGKLGFTMRFEGEIVGNIMGK